MGGIILFFQAKPYDIVDRFCDVLFMFQHFIKHTFNVLIVHRGLFECGYDGFAASLIDIGNKAEHMFTFFCSLRAEPFCNTGISLVFRPGSHGEVKV